MTPLTALRGRRSECARLDRVLDAARKGESRVLVLRGEPGIGKTALLDYAISSASDLRVLWAAGVESEMELAFASLQQLCLPLLDRLERLPDPQHEALSVVFGLRGGQPPNQFLVALAALNLLSDAAEERPLLCAVDDAQWLDDASTLAFAFVARRLLAEPITVLAVTRTPIEAFRGLPELVVSGVGHDDARRLLTAAIPGPLDPTVAETIIAEAHGNPLALLELPRGSTPAQIAGGFALPDAEPVAARIERSFVERVRALPAASQRLLLAAAAEPLGDVTLLWRTAELLGVSPPAADPAVATGLIEIGAGVRFRHPLVRSAIYRSAAPANRREVHSALADATDPDTDPDRRAWHRAHATVELDETVAWELERSADRAQRRGGIAAAAAFLERAAELTPDSARRAGRTLAAAQAKLNAGAFEAAAALLAMVEAEPPDELSRARIDLLRAGIAYAQNRSSEATPLLLGAARRLERLDVALARETYLDAIAAAIHDGRLARGPGLQEVGEAARGAPPPQLPRVPDRLLDALAVRLTDGYSASAPLMKRVLAAFCDEEIPVQEAVRWLWLASVIAADLWDDERWHLVATRHVTIAREAGALSALPDALDARAYVHVIAGELAAAASLYEEVRTVCAAIGNNAARIGPLALAVWRGRESEARRLIESTMSEAVPTGQGAAVTVTQWFRAVLCNSLGQYKEALGAAQMAAGPPREFSAPRWGLEELVEAATRSGAPELATNALERLSVTTQASGTDWALGVEARLRALVSEGDDAEKLYGEAIERLAATRVQVELARARLLYGEWLRREQRRADAREQLRTAHEMFSQMGVEGFAERARRELQATGESARRRMNDPRGTLTPQEAQIARLAQNGLSNPEIGAQLFISPRTVQYHLRKVFQKLDIASRNQLVRISESRLTST
jgi:DNA-binding CsgD family transcriptional regulator